MTDDDRPCFPGNYDAWATTDDSLRYEPRRPLTLVICQHDHRRLTTHPETPCEQCVTLRWRQEHPHD